MIHLKVLFRSESVYFQGFSVYSSMYFPSFQLCTEEKSRIIHYSLNSVNDLTFHTADDKINVNHL